MKKVGNHTSISRFLLFCLAVSLTFSLPSFSQEAPAPQAADAAAPAGAEAAAPAEGAGDPVKGKELFSTNCASCHKLDGRSTGPALRGVADKHDRQWIYKWVHNSSEMIASGDAAAVKLFNDNNKVTMTAFPQLSETDIDNILAYTSAPAPTVEKPKGGEVVPQGSGVSENIILAALVLVLVVLVVMLVLVNRTLRRVAASNGVEVVEKTPGISVWKAYAKNQFLVLVTAILLLLSSSYFLYGWLMQVGVDKNYQPVQPIHFSHKIHAGDNGIDCKYCHSAARVSKNSGIPSLNVCMNCHKNISEFTGDKDSVYDHSKEFYTGEIQKLYTATGWDAATQKYSKPSAPVKWVRIHNLPDFAYFNHSQHVSVAGVECQKCHGPVETFEVMKQFAPLTMGWCVNCHRETDVKAEGNAYYDKIHAELARKFGKQKLTAADMGGTECGKCHY